MVTPKKRKNMKHMVDMNDYDFCQWILQNPASPLRVSWKLDGFFLRFGKDETGKMWFQTARSPVIFDPMELIWYSLGKSEDAIQRAENYFHLVTTIWGSDIMASLENDTGFECEVFDKAVSTLDKACGSRTFVHVPYRDSFFPTGITLGVYRKIKSSTGEVLEEGYDFGSPNTCASEISTFGTQFFVQAYFEYFETCVLGLVGAPLDALRSLKHKDRPLKLATKHVVRTLKEQLGEHLLDEATRANTMGPKFEGVVVSVNNIGFKIVTDYFKTLIAMNEVLGV